MKQLKFIPEFMEPILTGKKITTRRQKCPWKVGDIVRATDPKGVPFARLKITKIELQALGDMNNNDARHEGFESLSEFNNVWEKLFGPVDEYEMVAVIDFQLEKPIEYKPKSVKKLDDWI